MNERHILNLAAVAVIGTIIAAIVCGFSLERYSKQRKEEKKAAADKEFRAELKSKAEELHSMPFENMKAKVSLPATNTYQETKVVFKDIHLESDSCMVIDTDYCGHYGEYTSGYSTFIPDSEKEYERRIAFDYLLSALEKETGRQIRDWAIFNNKKIRFDAPGAVDLKSNAIPFKSEARAKSLLMDYYGDPHECGEYWGNDLDSEEIYAKNDALADMFYAYFPEEKE